MTPAYRAYAPRMALEELPITDEWVQEMLWSFTRPSHIRWDYTKLDAIKHFEAQWKLGETWFFGDKAKNVLLRTEVMNPKVLAVHVCGNGLAIRGVLREGMQRVFKEYKFDIVELWTMDARLIAIQKAAGFNTVAHVPGRMFIDGQMVDITVMHYTRKDYERDCRLAYRRLHPDEGEVQA